MLDGAPGPSLGRGAGTTTRGYATYDDGSAPSSWCEKSRKTHEKGKTKTTESTEQNTLAASRPETGPQKSTRRIQKRVGPRMAPQGNTKKQDTRPKKVNRQARRDNKRNKDKQHKRVWRCALLLPKLSFLKKNKKATTSAKKQKEERKNPKHRPDIKKIFPRHDFREREVKK